MSFHSIVGHFTDSVAQVMDEPLPRSPHRTHHATCKYNDCPAINSCNNHENFEGCGGYIGCMHLYSHTECHHGNQTSGVLEHRDYFGAEGLIEQAGEQNQ